VGAVAGVGLAALAAGAWAAAPAEVRFNRDIRPILSDHCFKCHGPDANKREANLRLDTPEGATALRAGGTHAVAPGRPEASEAIRRLTSTNADEMMPPTDAPTRPTAAQIALVREWIRQGARYEGHWAYQPLARPTPPAVRNRRWARNPVDAFVLARLETEGLKPAPEADRRTLIRRLSLDLHGLPPTPERVAAFAGSRDPQAYEKLVDELLASPRFAERLAVYWLDMVRYADTIGFHGDMPFSVWPYRDYVLKAFHENRPFDQFTREQLAGDLLPNASDETRVASAYNRLLRISTEGGVQAKEYLAKYAADRVRTTAGVWLGATMGCAECHDHKYDPISAKDFYSFQAFFADLNEKGFYDRGFAANDWGTRLLLPTPEQKAQLADLDARLAMAAAALEGTAADRLASRDAWEARVADLDRARLLAWQPQKPVAAETAHGAVLTVQPDSWVVASGPNPDREVYALRLQPGEGRFTGLRLQTGVDEMFPGNRIARGGTTFVLTGVEIEAKTGGRASPVALASAAAREEGEGHPAMAAVDGRADTGWAITFGHSREHLAVFRFAAPVETTADTVLTVRLRHESDQARTTIGKFQLALSRVDEPTWDPNGLPEPVLAALRTPEASRTDAQRQVIAAHFRRVSPDLAERRLEVERLRAERSILAAQVPATLVSEALPTPRPIRILPRGNFLDETGPEVQPAAPGFLPPLRVEGRPTRLHLADWLTAPENPLTPRVFANRMWKLFFGAGLSRTLEDFGARGELPSHPELLDWLAVEFRDGTGGQGWNIKHLIRTIVTSSTYRQSSAAGPKQLERDPENRLLARQTPLRLDAEFVRDNALAISGLLVERLGGPSVRPYQPDGYWAPLNFPKREYVTDTGDRLYRRGLYTHWQRTFLHPSLLAFDASSREECTVNRPTSNTPLQALVLLNDPSFVEAARVFAERILRDGGKDLDRRLDWAYRRALARPPTSAERAVLRKLHRGHLARYEADPAAARAFLQVGQAPVPGDLAAPELAAMAAVARTLLNLHETITRD
jgi:hypothetical protein